jgi:hypothetical protein
MRRDDMGSRRIRLLTDSQICRLYRDGASRTEISLRSKLLDHEVCAVLRANGLAIRNSVEGQRISKERRNRQKGRLHIAIAPQ